MFCDRWAEGHQAKIMVPGAVQYSGLLQEQAAGLWQDGTYQHLPQMVANDVWSAGDALWHMNVYPQTLWVTTAGGNYVPVASESGSQGAESVSSDTRSSEQNVSCGALCGRVWELSRDEQGCRQVQKAFEDATSDQERMSLTSEFVGHVWQALKCRHANHVIQKCIHRIRPPDVQFIIDELRFGASGGVVQAARHRYGCRIIQRILEHCPVGQVGEMVGELLADAAALSAHIYGNYVIQHMLEFCTSDVVTNLTVMLEQHVPVFAADSYAGGVIAKALSLTGNERRSALAATLLQHPEQLVAMSCCRRGHLPVKEALEIADGVTRRKACSDLAMHFDRLQSYRYGRTIRNIVIELQSASAAPVN